jgi:hypothetical protein
MRSLFAAQASQVFWGWLALVNLAFSPVQAGEPLALVAKPESGENFRYACELRNEGARPIRILAFNSLVEVVQAPWRFEYRSTWLPRMEEGKKRKATPYLIIEATSASKGKMLLIVPEDKGASSVPPSKSPENFYPIAAGESSAFLVDFPERPSRVVLTYFVRGESGEIKRCRLAKQFP